MSPAQDPGEVTFFNAIAHVDIRGEHLRTLRRMAQWDQSDAAGLLDVSRRTVIRWERAAADSLPRKYRKRMQRVFVQAFLDCHNRGRYFTAWFRDLASDIFEGYHALPIMLEQLKGLSGAELSMLERSLLVPPEPIPN